MRKAGVVIPKYQLIHEAEWRGDLRIIDTRENALNRIVKLAQLMEAKGDGQVALVLFDPQMLWMNEDRFVLTGFERVGHGPQAVDYAQSWLCKLSPGASADGPAAGEGIGRMRLPHI